MSYILSSFDRKAKVFYFFFLPLIHSLVVFMLQNASESYLTLMEAHLKGLYQIIIYITSFCCPKAAMCV